MLAKAKAQGMYPTPTQLAQRLIKEVFDGIKTPPPALLEPSAGLGVFIIETWEYWRKERGLNRQQMSALVENTYAFENDHQTFEQLNANLLRWCKVNQIAARPSISRENFILNIDRYSSSFLNGVTVLGNPPWDEFTTRKHDNTGLSSVRQIRDEREQEKRAYAPQGVKNLYQAFLFALLKISCPSLRIVFVLPRQILGDMSSAFLRQQLACTGEVEFTVYKNKDDPRYYFEAVDSNFEIVALSYSRSSRTDKKNRKPNIWIRRGFDSDYFPVTMAGADFTIPCPPSNKLATTLRKLLGEQSFGDWADRWGVSVSRGKVQSNSPKYGRSQNGRTISAYLVNVSLDHSKLVVNKILPNSRRKIKAALVPDKAPIADSLVMVDAKDKRLYPYLILMLNSRAVELALWSLTTNINLNNFRLMSLPIPEPTAMTLKIANTYYSKCVNGILDWESASDRLTSVIFSLNSQDKTRLVDAFPDRWRESEVEVVA